MVGVREAMETVVTPHFYCNADASRLKGDNFRAIMDRVLIGSFDITAGS